MDFIGYNDTYSTIHPVFTGKNPEASRSSVPFEKGYQLLCYLQQIIGVGGMRDFIKFYITQY